MKKRERHIRPEDADVFFRSAMAFPPGHPIRQRFLALGLGFKIVGVKNEERGIRDQRRGRPCGTKARARIDDTAALAFMDRIAAETGETRARRLARAAISAGKVAMRASEYAIEERLARGWRKRSQT